MDERLERMERLLEASARLNETMLRSQERLEQNNPPHAAPHRPHPPDPRPAGGLQRRGRRVKSRNPRLPGLSSASPAFDTGSGNDRKTPVRPPRRVDWTARFG